MRSDTVIVVPHSVFDHSSSPILHSLLWVVATGDWPVGLCRSGKVPAGSFILGNSCSVGFMTHSEERKLPGAARCRESNPFIANDR